MDFLNTAIFTVHLFGGIDVSLLAIILFVIGAVAAGVYYFAASKKDISKRKRMLITVAIAAVGFIASLACSILTDSTAAVSSGDSIFLLGLTMRINRVALTFNIGSGFDIYWYGIIISVGFLLALLYGFKNADRFGINKDAMMDVIIVGLLGAIVCARAYYLIFDGVPLTSFSEIFAIHNGGIAIYGGVIGAFVCGGITAKIRKINVLNMFDLAAIGFFIGQGIGRWGNFVNQEVFGRATGSNWFGMTGTSIIIQTNSTALVHPLFLYESLWCLIGLIVLHKLSKKRVFYGQLFFTYLAFYGAGRFVFEGLRNSTFILLLGQSISISQLVSVGAVIVGLVGLYVLNKNAKAVPDTEYESQFDERFDDPDLLDAAYGLLDCEWDCDDGELEAAYNAKIEFFNSVEAEDDAQREKVNEKITELSNAYDYIVNSRKAESAVDAELSAEE